MPLGRLAAAGVLVASGTGLVALARYLHRERRAWLLAGPVPDDPARRERAIDVAAGVAGAYGGLFLVLGLTLLVTDAPTELVGYAATAAAVGGGLLVALFERRWIR